MAKTPYDLDLDRNPANFQPLTPLLFLERAAAVHPEHVAIVRPGLIVGPHDPTGRFTWWVQRLQRGGETVKSLRKENTLIKLPDEENGNVFIFRLFNRISYGIILDSKRPVHVGDGAIASGK